LAIQKSPRSRVAGLALHYWMRKSSRPTPFSGVVRPLLPIVAGSIPINPFHKCRMEATYDNVQTKKKLKKRRENRVRGMHTTAKTGQRKSQEKADSRLQLCGKHAWSDQSLVCVPQYTVIPAAINIAGSSPWRAARMQCNSYCNHYQGCVLVSADCDNQKLLQSVATEFRVHLLTGSVSSRTNARGCTVPQYQNLRALVTESTCDSEHMLTCVLNAEIA